MNVLKNFQDAVTLKRGAGSRTEMAYVSHLVKLLPQSMIDEAGNIWVDLRTEAHHRTCFTAHTDTVHHTEGTNEYEVDGKFWRAKGAALGADDGAGIALLLHLIENNVPALYVFFRGEEIGGIGSTYASENLADMFDGIDRAIAFDRAGYYDVITHQAGGRCCSDKFASALAEALSTEDMSIMYMPCDKGVFTDTANLVSIVSECTNLSVGYNSQHGDKESQDVEFLQTLAAKIITIDWDSLPTERKLTQQYRYKGIDADYAPRKLQPDNSPMLEALEAAIYDNDLGPLRTTISEYMGPEYAYYIERLSFDRKDMLTAYDMLLDGEDDSAIIDGILFDSYIA